MKKIVALSLLAAVGLSGCNPSSSSLGVIVPESIQILSADENATDVRIGNTLQLIIASPTEGASLSVVWSVDNTSIATISENGLLTGVSRGTAVVTATSSLNEAISSTKSISITRAPGYRVMDANGNVVMEHAQLYKSIIYSAQNSLSSNKMYVLDENDVEVFRYSSVTKFYCYLGEKYEKTVTSEAAAATFVKENKNAYVIDSRGQNYTHLSQKVLPYRSNIAGEMFSGSYMYHYTQSGSSLGGVGFGYIKFTLEMSKMKLKFDDKMVESGWNAYIFTPIVTTSPWSFCDVGLIHGGGSTRGYWNVVFANNGNMHSKKDGLATIMEYNENDGYYHGVEDLEFEIYVTQEAYCFNLTNLSTGITRHYEDPRPTGLTLNTSTLTLILAASYCPVTVGTKVWDPRAGLTMENARFINPIVKRYRSDNDYTNAEAFPFITNSEISDYTLLQQPDNLTYNFGNQDGDNFMEVSIFYDSRERSMS